MSSSSIGKYRLIAELGQGGMADVFLAVARGPAGLGFSKLVVIKRLREHLANDPDFVGMLVDEARIAARLNHPNVVQTIEIGESDGQYFLAMEYLDGQPLRRVLNRAAGFPQNLHYHVLVRVLSGLHHAHELADYDRSPLHIVHRDVTPHNVFITYDGQVKVVDFGIAKAVGRVSETRHGIIKGKAPYMAPEQALGLPVDRRADIFSVGVMLWEAAVGARMWAGVKDEAEILRRVGRGEIPSSPRDVRSAVPETLDAICRRALATTPDDRFATAAEFEAALASHLEATGQRASERELGQYLTSTFAGSREEAKAIIEAQLQRLETTSSSSFRPIEFPPESGTPSRRSPVAITFMPNSEEPETADSTKSTVQAGVVDPIKKTLRSRAEPLRTRRLVGLSLLGILALAVGLWAAAARLRFQTVPTQSSSASASVATAPSASAAPPENEQVTVTLRASPPQSRFSIDDNQPLPNPYVGRRAKDNSEHRVTVQAPGYATISQVITFDDDVTLQLSLARADGADAGTRPGPPPRRGGGRR